MGLSACAGFVSNPVVYEPKFSKFEPIKLKVVKVEIIDKSKFVGNKNIAMRLPVPPILAIEKWVQMRLKPMGRKVDDIIRITINDSSVIETNLQQDTSIKGLLTNQQSYRYEFFLNIAVEVIDLKGFTKASSEVQVTRYVTTSDSLTLNERNIAWIRATKSLINDFDKKVIFQINKYFNQWII